MKIVADYQPQPSVSSNNSNSNSSIQQKKEYSKLSKRHHPPANKSFCSIMKINRNVIIALVIVLSLHYMTQHYLHFRVFSKKAPSTATSTITVAVEKLIQSYEASLSQSFATSDSSGNQHRIGDDKKPGQGCVGQGGNRDKDRDSEQGGGGEGEEDVPALVTFIIPTMFRPSLVDTLTSLLNQTSCQWRAIIVYQTPPLFVHEHPAAADVASSSTHTPPLPLTSQLHKKPLDHFQVLPAHLMDDDRFHFLQSTASVEVNFAGNMRNDALLQIPHHPKHWIAFVDDDDTVLPHYVTSLLQEAERTPTAAVVLFRMLCITCYSLLVPPPSHLNLVRSYTGISFAVKSHLLLPPPPPAPLRGQEKSLLHEEGTGASSPSAPPLSPFSFPSGANEDYCLLYNIRNGGHTLVLSPSITYLVKGPQEAYVAELASSQGGEQTTIQRSVITALSGTYPAECQQKQLPKDALLSGAGSAGGSGSGSGGSRSTTHLGFTFPEAGHYIFQQNIAGLQRALSQANKAGCLMPWLLESLHIDIHFSYLTPVTRGRPYIQVQMEQVHSRRNMFTDRYIKKLQGALQVWAIAPSHFVFLQQYLQIQQTYFVPLWLMIDPAISARHTCRNQSLVPKQAIVHRVQEGLPYSSDTKDALLQECLILPRNPARGDEELVAMYGALSGSDNDRRLKLCVALKEALAAATPSPLSSSSSSSSFECFHGIYGPSLDQVLCTADIIVVDRFYSNGAIESHRIDPLLKMGKAVVSMSSKDANMQTLYGEAVVFVHSVGEMAARVGELLADRGSRERQQRRGQEFIAMKSRLSQPLCNAFAPLQQQLIAHSKLLPSLQHRETPKEKAKRLKREKKAAREGGTKKKKLRPVPPSPPMPDEVRAAAASAAAAAAAGRGGGERGQKKGTAGWSFF